MKYFIVLFLVAILTECSAQERKTDINCLNLKGKVSSIKVNYYSFYFQDSILSKKIKTDWNYGEKQKLAFYAEFYDNGFYRKRINYYDSIRTDTSYYKYDNKGFLSSVISYDTIITKCNMFGNVIKFELLRNDYINDYEYNEEGNLIFSRTLQNGKTLQEYKAKYEEDKVIEEKEFGENGILISKRIYTYNELGQTKVSIFSLENEYVIEAISQNDSLDNPIKITYYDDSASVSETEIYIYEYDSNGNWIKQFSYLDNNPMILSERIIKYYNE